MFIQPENPTTQWIELARLLQDEWHGQPIDQDRACTLAASLLPRFPEMKATLGHLHRRLSAAAE